MTWFGFAMLTAVTYGLFSFFVKLTADTKINHALAAVFYQITATIVPLIWLFIIKTKGTKIEAPQSGIWFSLIAGMVIGSSAFFVFKAYSSGGNISIVAPIVLFGSVVIASILDVIFLKEQITLNIIDCRLYFSRHKHLSSKQRRLVLFFL